MWQKPGRKEHILLEFVLQSFPPSSSKLKFHFVQTELILVHPRTRARPPRLRKPRPRLKARRPQVKVRPRALNRRVLSKLQLLAPRARRPQPRARSPLPRSLWLLNRRVLVCIRRDAMHTLVACVISGSQHALFVIFWIHTQCDDFSFKRKYSRQRIFARTFVAIPYDIGLGVVRTENSFLLQTHDIVLSNSASVWGCSCWCCLLLCFRLYCFVLTFDTWGIWLFSSLCVLYFDLGVWS